jgi:two-component system, NtrC family, response regulator AtoC
LRERGSDIIILAKKFINDFCTDNKIHPKTISQSAVNKLLGYHFPGNVRELKSIAELSVVLCDTDEISADNIMTGGTDLPGDVTGEELTLREYNIRIVKNYLNMYDNNPKIVADKLDIGVATVYRMLKEEKSDKEE